MSGYLMDIDLRFFQNGALGDDIETEQDGFWVHRREFSDFKNEPGDLLPPGVLLDDCDNGFRQ